MTHRIVGAIAGISLTVQSALKGWFTQWVPRLFSPPKRRHLQAKSPESYGKRRRPRSLARIKEIGNRDEARDDIVRRAMIGVQEESAKLRDQEDIVRRQLAQTRGDIAKLVDVLKDQGANSLRSIQGELTRLESEEKQKDKELDRLARLQKPFVTKVAASEKFLKTWTNVGDLLESAEPGEQQQILRHYIDVIEFRNTEEAGEVGV